MPIGVIGCLSLHVSREIDWWPVKGVPHLSPYVDWDWLPLPSKDKWYIAKRWMNGWMDSWHCTTAATYFFFRILSSDVTESASRRSSDNAGLRKKKRNTPTVIAHNRPADGTVQS